MMMMMMMMMIIIIIIIIIIIACVLEEWHEATLCQGWGWGGVGGVGGLGAVCGCAVHQGRRDVAYWHCCNGIATNANASIASDITIIVSNHCY